MKVVQERTMLSLSETAQALGVSYQTILRMIKRGDINAVRIGRNKWVEQEQLGRYLRKGE